MITEVLIINQSFEVVLLRSRGLARHVTDRGIRIKTTDTNKFEVQGIICISRGEQIYYTM